MTTLIQPHGGQLVNRVLEGEERLNWLERAKHYPTITANAVLQSDLLCIATGVYSPLKGFINQQDYASVCQHMRLQNGMIWSIPITMAVSEAQLETIKRHDYMTIKDQGSTILAVVQVEHIYRVDRLKEAEMVYGTTEERHPGVKRLYQTSPWCLSGDVRLLNRPQFGDFSECYHDPIMTRAHFQERGWKKVVGFQTRNPIHRAHEYIQKAALETVDALFLNPLIGETKTDDIPVEVRMKSYQTILERYYPQERVYFSAFPAAMRYAGPREAVIHAISRQNYGCTHFIVGRDHAGVGDYYGTYEGQHIFDQFSSQELEITLMFFEHSFYCKRCEGMASFKTCPHDTDAHVVLSGTKVREMLRAGKKPPSTFSRPEVVDILIEGMKSR
ncbi:sulfate adenylyltransferase [Hazenella sp. IB182357]|uniref:Sulfate adenylyltransferase n=1 Tax=Polycladospora coralii TaxID=2771432 RepID=A0A926RU70_9BACL|nr:sulfate adenylyltransferase [Polycladospora coralii]MBD1373620.1 sulfate adenylyltransferase [Polycladospora coralii]MBS7529662.1 sulfate adenylyltransferase [Polycladospora coralii]